MMEEPSLCLLLAQEKKNQDANSQEKEDINLFW